MAYKISGTMVTGCECTGPLCPCNVDGIPNTPAGTCRGVIVLGVGEGNLDDLDLWRSQCGPALHDSRPAQRRQLDDRLGGRRRGLR